MKCVSKSLLLAFAVFLNFIELNSQLHRRQKLPPVDTDSEVYKEQHAKLERLPSFPERSLPPIHPNDPNYEHQNYGSNFIMHVPINQAVNSNQPANQDKSKQFQDPRPEELTSIRRIKEQPDIQKYYKSSSSHHLQQKKII
ncbi:uncharacterized protein LOC117173309 [Belonocnema kinseyi]|uniref:uncharacterized protein LOC117173309 n=1 Tax=Belonocnema kinseyi TaxID=2817044 RepID=UPI00143D2538|nr:uncharacterized protein LOC117173309 [Belonocnema kinseyi]